MRSIELRILIPFLIIITISLAVVGVVSYYGSYKIFDSLLIQKLDADEYHRGKAISEQLMELQKYTILVAIVAIIIVSQLTIFFCYSITKPIKKLAMACNEISKGNFDISIDYKRNDEIGILKDSFLRMAKELNRYISKVTEVSKLNHNIINAVNYGIVVFADENKKILTNRTAALAFHKDRELIKWVDNHIDKFIQGKIEKSDVVHLKKGGNRVKSIEYDISFFEDHYLLCFSDITEKEKLKSQMEHINKLSTIGEMSAALAHEIRNPLQGVKACFQVIESKLPNDEITDTLAPLIYKEIDRINEIVSGLLNFARPSDPKPVFTNIKTQLKSIIALMSRKLKEKNLNIDVNIDIESEFIFIDSSHLQQILINLISNAIKASGNNSKIDIVCIATADKINITIKDYGKGIPEHAQSKIFTPFYSTFEKGSGLGLSVVQSLIIKNNGSIKFKSSPSSGTQVKISFPFIFAHNVQ